MTTNEMALIRSIPKSMTLQDVSARAAASHLLQRAKSAGTALRFQSPMPASQPKLQRQPTIVMYADESRPLHSLQGSMESVRPMYADHGSQQDLTSPTMPAFHGGASLSQTPREFNPLKNRYQSASFRFNNRNNIDADDLAPLMMYRDILKQNLTTPARSGSSTPRAHFGRQGGAWRHIKQTNTHSNSNFLFIDGTVRIDDTIKYPIAQFGYPPMNRPQHLYSSPSNPDLSNSTARSFDPMTWSATDELHRRPSLARYSNRYERNAKDNFAYWPRDLAYQKPRCRGTATGTHKTWLGLSDAILKV